MTNPVLWTSTFTSGTIAHQVAAVSGLPTDVRFISLRAGDARKPDYLAINPKGQVPALQLQDGTVITEIPAILFWLAEAAPDSGLLPRDATAKAKGMEWLAWCHWTMGGSFFPAFVPARMTGGDEAAAILVRAAASERSATALALAETAVAKGGGTLLGTAEPTAPDIFLAGLVGFAGFLKLDISHLPGLVALREKVASMPGVAAANQREAAQG